MLDEKFYTVQEAADRLKVHPQTLYRYVSSGRLLAHRIGRSVRIPESGLEMFLAAPQTPVPPKRRPIVTRIT